MHSFLQRKLKNLHGEARVWGWSTPRPPPLIVQPKGGLTSKAGCVHGVSDPGGELSAHGPGGTQGAGQERSTARWPRLAGEDEVPLGRGRPPGETEARPHPRGTDTFGLLQIGGWSQGGQVSGWKPLTRCRRTGGRGRGPAPAPASWAGGAGHPLCSHSEPGPARPSAPAVPGWGALRGAPRGPRGTAKLAR